ncbi:shikimate kinase AroK [Pseudoteredinibacter isoporae]|uniref:Shikimate kinase n=1 Tax=Pseudoteredinibacter isoporae TaxID=570281 RepID=A0A7X0MU18_9GAMM|nr:shikimate kinase [Pseudoteredinibacter isoporae]NHO85379.1 shikimate kinase AroK [Pseudoteredinibacter isoporae]NIB26169.1 shikimate kinase AroK [Pseudoteredinibacter isoporae]
MKSIVLVGPMGVGKSTIGRLLATSLRRDFYDTDKLIEDRAGADISWIFDIEGEEGFRQRESNTLSELCQQDDLVIATGGGIIVREDNRKLLNKYGRVVYLTASISQLVRRTDKDKKRPLLQVDDPKQKIIELLESRDPLYREVADLIVETDGKTPKQVAESLAEQLQA